MSPIQIIVALFALFAISRVIVKARARTIPYIWAFVWSIAWLGVIAVALLPQTTDILAARVGIGRGVDLLVYLSILALFFIAFRMVVKLEALQQEMTKLVRELAIRSIDQKSE